MKINFKHLVIENFLSFGYAELDLSNKGYTLVNGINNCPNDNASSNGSGKSSIWSAITFALTGESVQGISKNLANIHAEDGARVELSFEIDNIPYKIVRYKDHKKMGNNLQFFVNGEDKSGKGIRDTEKILSDYLPDLTSSFIGSVIILGQGMPHRFAGNVPSGRKEVLEKLSKSDFMIEDIKNRLGVRKTELNTLLREKEDAILSATKEKQLSEIQLNSARTTLGSLESSDQYQDRIANCKTKIEKLNFEIEELRQQLQDKSSTLDSCRAQELALNNQLSIGISDIKAKYSTELDSLKSNRSQNIADSRSLQAEISRLESIKDTCPTCGQKLPNVHKADTTVQKEQLINLQEELATINLKIQDAELKQSEEINNLNKSFEQQKLDIINESRSIRDKMSSLSSSINSHNDELRGQTNSLIKAESDLKYLLEKKDELLVNITTLESSIDSLDKQIMYINTDRDDVKSRLDVVNKMVNITSRDFRGFLLTNVISYLSNRAKFYSNDIFKTEKIELALDGNNISIIYDGKVYENLSGGEQRKVDLICQFALRDMLCQFSGFRCNIICLDEVFDGLDQASCYEVVNTITKRLTDIESIFIVTHRAELMIPTDSTITVIKDENGISRIQ